MGRSNGDSWEEKWLIHQNRHFFKKKKKPDSTCQYVSEDKQFKASTSQPVDQDSFRVEQPFHSGCLRP